MNSTRPRRTVSSKGTLLNTIRATPSPLRTVFTVEPQESGVLYQPPSATLTAVARFKKDLFNYHLYLTKSIYDVDTPQTFKSVY